MFKTLLKHKLYEMCIDTFFEQIYRNFIIPKIPIPYFKKSRKLSGEYTIDLPLDIETELLHSLIYELSRVPELELAHDYKLISISMVKESPYPRYSTSSEPLLKINEKVLEFLE